MIVYCTHVHSPDAVIQSANQVTAAQSVKPCRYKSRASDNIHRRMTRLVWAERNSTATVTQITTLSKRGEQKSLKLGPCPQTLTPRA